MAYRGRQQKQDVQDDDDDGDQQTGKIGGKVYVDDFVESELSKQSTHCDKGT